VAVVDKILEEKTDHLKEANIALASKVSPEISVGKI
jgi:hypothetical protein